MHAATTLEGAAEDVGRHLADMAVRMRDQAAPIASSPAASRPCNSPTRRFAEKAAAISNSSSRRLGDCNRLQRQRVAENPLAGIACSPAAPTAKTARPTPPARSSMRPRSTIAIASNQCGRLSSPQRRLSLLRAARHAAENRADAHERLRCACRGSGTGVPPVTSDITGETPVPLRSVLLDHPVHQRPVGMPRIAAAVFAAECCVKIGNRFFAR